MKRLAVGKEQTVLGRELIPDAAALADERLVEDRAARHLRPFGHDEVLGDDAFADGGRRIRMAQHGAVDERLGRVDRGGRAEIDVDDFGHADDRRAVADAAVILRGGIRLAAGHRQQPVDQLGPVAMDDTTR